MITVAAGDNVVRLLPPLIVSEDEVAEAVRRIDRACARDRSGAAGAATAGSGRMSSNGTRHFLDLIDIPAAGAARDDRRQPRHEGAAQERGERAPEQGRSPARRWR